jgi:hypothetical protein
MYFTTALFAGLVLANIVTSTSIVKQADGPLPTNGPPSLEPNETTTKTTQHRRSHNWAGAVLRGSDFQTVTGTFVVPEVILPDDAHSHKRHAASAWVGLDGSPGGRKGVVMQTGLHMRIHNGKLRYGAWHQWYPNMNVEFSRMKIMPGDSVALTLSASSESGGIAIIENNTKKTSFNHTWVDQTPHLCRTGAEWIVEDYSVTRFGKKGRVPFANFGSVTFTNASALHWLWTPSSWQYSLDRYQRVV